MAKTRRGFLRNASVAAAVVGTTGSLAGCFGVLESGSGSDDDDPIATDGSDDPIAADRFEDGTFDYHFDTQNSTEHDWGTRERSDVPGDETTVGFVSEHSSGEGHTIRGIADEPYDLTGAESIELQFYAQAYHPNESWNSGNFELYSEDETARPLSFTILNTNIDGDPTGFGIGGELVEEVRTRATPEWKEGRWYRARVTFESDADATLARGKIWDPVSGSEPDEFQAESVLSAPLEGAYRPGFTASGRSEELRVEYDYWSVF